MKSHIYRPLWVALGIVALILVARLFWVPDDFGVNGRSFTYGFYRQGNVPEWAEVAVKYRGREGCGDCHTENAQENASSKHQAIQCENCHGPALDHPDAPALLSIDRRRELCLRCHAALAYPGSQRGGLKGIGPEDHNPGAACVDCHNPHRPDLEA